MPWSRREAAAASTPAARAPRAPACGSRRSGSPCAGGAGDSASCERIDRRFANDVLLTEGTRTGLALAFSVLMSLNQQEREGGGMRISSAARPGAAALLLVMMAVAPHASADVAQAKSLFKTM